MIAWIRRSKEGKLSVIKIIFGGIINAYYELIFILCLYII